MFMCPTHAVEIDQQAALWPVEKLNAMKHGHEAWVSARLRKGVANVGFAELEIVAKHVLNAPGLPTAAFGITEPTEKMRRNDLTDAVRPYIVQGAAKAQEVGNFVRAMARIDSEFPERLRSGFLAEYGALEAAGFEGDELFIELLSSVAGPGADFAKTAAALTVLVYLFEKCEVFRP